MFPYQARVGLLQVRQKKAVFGSTGGAVDFVQHGWSQRRRGNGTGGSEEDTVSNDDFLAKMPECLELKRFLEHYILRHDAMDFHSCSRVLSIREGDVSLFRC